MALITMVFHENGRRELKYGAERLWSGDEIPDYVWEALLERLGHTVVEVRILPEEEDD